jgi:RNA polymerase sigma-70 factor (ECF subfamily)
MIQIEMTMKPDLLSAAIKQAAGFFKRKEAITTNTFQLLLNPIKENLYNFILKTLGFSEDADDVYQETVLRAFKYKYTYDHSRPFKTWLFTIAHNEINNYFNKTRKKSHSMDPIEHADIAYDTGDQPLVRDIYEIAAQLGPIQGRVFFLFYDQGFSIAEISDITGLKQGNIKFILNRAREKIKQKLGLKGDHNE